MQCMFKSLGFELVMSISNRKMNNTCSCLTTILCEIEKDFFLVSSQLLWRIITSVPEWKIAICHSLLMKKIVCMYLLRS